MILIGRTKPLKPEADDMASPVVETALKDHAVDVEDEEEFERNMCFSAHRGSKEERRRVKLLQQRRFEARQRWTRVINKIRTQLRVVRAFKGESYDDLSHRAIFLAKRAKLEGKACIYPRFIHWLCRVDHKRRASLQDLPSTTKGLPTNWI